MKRFVRTRRAWIAGVLALGLCSLASAAESAKALHVIFLPQEQRLDVKAVGLDQGSYEVTIETDGLTKVETGDDVNEPGIIYLPPPKGQATEGAAKPVAENVFFFNDLATADGWELVVQFDPDAAGTWKLNGRLSPLVGAMQAEVIVPVEALEHGENLLHIRGEDLRVPKMFFRKRVETSGGEWAEALQVTHAAWNGRVRLLRAAKGEGTLVAEQVVTTPAPAAARATTLGERWWEDRAALDQAALAVGRSLLNSQVQDPGSLFNGGFNLVYDPQHQSHRMAHWLWAWGPSIDFLIELSKRESARANGAAGKFRAVALAAGERSLQFEMTDPNHPAYGVSTVRWEPSRATPLGWAEYLSTADSLFLAGWGWMSLHRETGRAEFLERTKSLVAAAERLMDRYPVVPQDWIIERNTWTPHTLDESVFGMIGFRRLFEATGSSEVAASGRRFLDSHLKHMGRESGLLARAWMREEDKEIWDPDIKGHAWVIEGYLDAHQFSGDTKYLRLADELAQKVMDCQADDGSWTYLFTKPKPGDPIDDKGTAIWAFLFYDLYKRSKNPEHLAAGRRALGWCLRQQYHGDDPNLRGAIFHPNSMAYVRRRPMSILYTTTFFGHALLQELALQESAGRE